MKNLYRFLPATVPTPGTNLPAEIEKPNDMKTKFFFSKKSGLIHVTLFAFVFLCCAVTNLAQAQTVATVTTDKSDYAPGDYVTISGTGWQAGETVRCVIKHMVFTTHLTQVVDITANASGNILDATYQIAWTDLGETFLLTATGQTSGRTASTEFTDASLAISSINVSAANICAGTTMVIIHSFSVNGSGNPKNITGISFTTNGTYSVSEISNFKLYYTQTATFLTTNLLGTISTPNAAGLQTFPAFIREIKNNTNYFWIIMEVASSVIDGHTISVGQTLPANITSLTTPTGYGAASGTQTLRALPTLTGTSSSSTTLCSGSAATITLSGLLPNTAQTISYTVGGTSGTQTAYVTSDGSGAATFNTIALTAANSGQTLTITGINRTDVTPNCTFPPTSNNTATLPTVNSRPTAAITSSAATICNGSSTTISGTITASGSWTLTLNNSGGTVTGTGSGTWTKSVSPSATTTYAIVSLTDANCTSIAADLTGSEIVTVNSITPGVIGKGAVQPGPGCDKLDPGITSVTTAATGSASPTYIWQQSTDGGANWSTISGATSDQLNPSEFTQTTSFKRIATSSLNSVSCSAESNVLTYVVNASPGVAAITAVGSTDICVGSTLQLQDLTPGGVWSSSNSSIASVNPSTGLVTGVSAGTLNLGIHYTVSNEYGCSTTRNKTVTVIALPTASITGNNSPVCLGENAEFYITGTVGATATYKFVGGSNLTIPLTDGTATVTVAGATANQTITLVSVTNGTCSQNLPSNYSSVTVNPLPTAWLRVGFNDPICSGANAKFYIEGTPGATLKYNINGGSEQTHVITNGTNTVTVAGVTTNQTFNLVSVYDGVCTSNLSGSITVPVRPLLTTSISPDPAVVVEGQTIQLFSNPSGGGGFYDHSWTGTGATYLVNASVQNPIFNATTVGSFNLTYTARDAYLCTGTDDITVIVTGACTNPSSGGTIAGAQTICAGDNPAAFTSTATPGGQTGTLEYMWQVSDASPTYNWNNIDNSNNVTYDAPVLTSTRWYRRLARVDCSSDWNGAAASNVLEVTVNALPVCSIGGVDGPLCPSSVTQFSAPEGMSYVWSITGNGSISIPSTGQTVSVTAGATCNASFTLTLIITDGNGCSSSCEKTVNVNDTENPVLTVPSSGLALGCNPTTTLPTEASVVAASSATDNCGTPVITAVAGTITGTCSKSQTFTVTATDGCGNTDVKTVTYTWTEDILAPTVLTAEGDDNNIGCNPTAANIEAAFTAPTFTDVCDANVSVAVATVHTGTGCVQSDTRTWTASDDCSGLTTAVSQVISYTIDNLAPTIATAEGADVHIGFNPNATAIEAAFTAPTFADPCGTPTVEVTNSHSVTGQSQSDTRTWTATDACSNSKAVSQTISYTVDLGAPTLNVAGFTDNGTDMTGDLGAGYTLNTTNVPTTDHLVQFKSPTTATETLAAEYFGLKLTASTVTAADLKAYYAAIGVPAPFLAYLNDAADGDNPFVYINGSTIKLVDAAKHDLAPGLGDVDMTIPDNFPLGTYTVSGKIKDLAGNETTVTYILIVAGDRDKPVITLLGDANVAICQGLTYSDAGATALDNVDGDITSQIVKTGTVNSSIPNTYSLTYDVSDAAGNSATQVIRTVTVNATPLAPGITIANNCNGTATLTATGYTGSLVWSPGGATTESITVNTNGTYKVRQTISECTSPEGSASVTLLVHSGTDWYVSTTGNDANMGTETCPFATIQRAVTVASPADIIHVAAGIYTETGQIVIAKNLTIVGADKATTIIKPTQNTGNSGDARGWFLVNSGITFDLSNVTLDGTGFLVMQAIRHQGNGLINNCNFTQIKYNESGPDYRGAAIEVYTDGNVDVTNCAFTQVGRYGVQIGTASEGLPATGTYSGNTFTGKGTGNYLDYAFEIGWGANITISGNTITNCKGVASSDGSGSAGISVWDDPGTQATISGNTLTGNASAIAVAILSGTNPVVNIGDGNIITGGDFGIDIQNVGASGSPVLTFGSSTFKGQSTAAIQIVDGISAGTSYDISSVIFQNSGGIPITDNFEKENLVIHAIDAPNRGLFVWNASNLYVTPTSFTAPTTTAPSIQRAIDAASAGWTVNVAAGTFDNSIDITKPLVVLGQGITNTFLDRSSNTTAGNVVNIHDLAGNVKVDGFSIKTGPASSVASNGIHISGLTGPGTITVSNNEIWGVQSATQTTEDNYGLIAGYFTATTPKLVFDHNIVHGGSDNPILIEQWMGPTEITNNTISQNPLKDYSSSDVIFMMNHDKGHNTAKQLISGNTIDMGWGTTNQRGAGISVASSYTGGTSPGGFTDVEVSNNILSNLKPNRRGISTWNNSSDGAGGNIVNALISGNEISNAAGFEGEFGIRVLGKATGTQITNNLISGVTNSVKIQGWNGHEAVTTSVNSNSLLATATGLGINNLTTATIAASCNWFGTVSNESIATKISGPVTYNPWLDSGGDGSGIGFQPTGQCNGSPVALVNAVADPIICGNTTGSITISWSGGTSPYSLAWTGGGSITDIANSPYTISDLIPGNYSVTVTDANLSSATSNSAIIQVNPRPLSVISGTTTICNGTSTNLSIAFTGTAPFTYSINGQSSVIATANPEIVSISPTSNTTYTVTSLNDANCVAIAGGMTGSAVVTVKPNPTISGVTVSAASVCFGSPVTFTANGLLNGTTDFVYSVAIDGGTPEVGNANDVPVSGGTATFPVPEPNVGTYVIKIISATVNGCTTTFTTNNTASFTINPIPTAPTVVVGNNPNGTSTLTASDFTGTLLWSTNETTTSITVNTGGIYTVTQTVNGCTSPAGSVSVLQTPTTTIQPQALVSCGVYKVDVTVQDFANVGAISLKLNYDPLVISYQSADISAVLINPIFDGNNTTGQFSLSYSGNGIDLPDNAVLFTLHFSVLPTVASETTTSLNWSRVTAQCEYAGPGGVPVYFSTFDDKNITVNTCSISGTLKYNNQAQTPMNRVELTLTPGNAKVTTDADGKYSFTGLQNGVYSIAVTDNQKEVGYINSTDAGAANLWGTSGGDIEYVKFLAGDVAENNLYINNVDALRIQKFFVNGLGFDKAPWVYWKKGVKINNNFSVPKPDNFNVTLSGTSIVGYDLFGMCTGDFNGSFTPTTLKSTSSSLMLTSNGNMQVGANQKFELPMRVGTSMEVGAVSMILRIPSVLVNVQDVMVNGSSVAADWTVNGDELRIGWYSSMPINVAAKENLITLKLMTTETFKPEQSIDIELPFNPLNELADGNFKVVDRATLEVAKVGNLTVGITDHLDFVGLTISNYPNPFSNSTTVAYTLPVDGKVSIVVYNELGQSVMTLIDANQNAGKYTIPMNSSMLRPGIYLAKLMLANKNGNLVGTVKLSVRQ